MKELLALLQAAGYSDFREARGPMGFTQRQGGGKFTSDEATAFIGRLQEAEIGADAPVTARPARALSAAERALRNLPADQLAGELQRRGWVVIEP